jgi:hypothetical protein
VVGARAATGPQRGRSLFVSESDSSGNYTVAVPSGSYWLEVNQMVGLGGLTVPGFGDTFTVANQIRQVDIECGSIRVFAHAPGAMEGRELTATLKLPRSTLQSTAEVRGGELTFSFSLLQAPKFSLGFGFGPPLRLAATYWLDGTYDPDSAKIFSLPVDHEVLLDVSLEGWASLSGVIESGCPGAATVDAVAAADSTIVGSAVTDTGDFLLDVLSARPIKIRATIDGVERWFGGASFETAEVFDLQPGSIVTGLRLRGGGIRCELEGPGYVLAHSGMAVLIGKEGRSYARFYGTGLIEFCNLAAGSYLLYLSSINDDQAWGSQWFDGATSLGSATPIDVVDGTIRSVTAHLGPGATVTGRILDETGEPFGYGLVVLVDADRVRAAPYWVQPRDLGSFTFYGVGDGSYFAAVVLNDEYWWFPGTSDPSAAQSIPVLDHADVGGIDWRLP